MSFPRRFQRLLPNLALAVLVSILGAMRLPQKAIAQTQASFSDTESGHWANIYVEALVSQGFLAGYPDGTYRGNRAATRAEYASAVTKAFAPATKREKQDFLDVPDSYWAYQAIQTAYRGALFDFHTKEDADIPVLRIDRAETNGATLTSLGAGLDLQPQAIDVLTFTCVSGKGQSNEPYHLRDRPDRAITRYQMAAVIYQALVKKGKISPITPSPSKDIALACPNLEQ